jgi:hypothetical protein
MGEVSFYTANDPRTRSAVVEKSKKMVGRTKKPAEKTAVCGEGYFQALRNTFITSNLRTAQTAQGLQYCLTRKGTMVESPNILVR